MKWAVKCIEGFARFWYDFIVGDSVALAIGGVAVLVLAFVLARTSDSGPVEVLVPLAVIATLAASLRGAR